METAKETYKTARAFKVAIADRLRALATKSGEPHLELYRRVAIDRFLARIDWSRWTAKGGYVLQRRLPKARRTKDIDLSTDYSGFALNDRTEQQSALLEAFRQAASTDAGDYFTFQVTGGTGQFAPHSPRTIHIGLGKATQVDAVKIVWPNAKHEEQKIAAIKADSYYTIEKGNAPKAVK